jgi:hypothetical protein
MQNTRLTAVGDEFVQTPALEAPEPTTPDRRESMLVSLLVMTLRTLPAKLVIALAGLADLAMIASAFVLWLLVIDNPTTLQLVGVGGYATFVLIALFVRRR